MLGWIGRWDEAILKVREVEYHLLISLPLVVLLRQAERACLAKPEEEALRISRIYQSPLLSPEFMRQVLTLLANRGYAPEAGTLGRELGGGWLWDDEKDTLWKLFTGQLEGVDYPFEQTIPQPWSYQIPALMQRLEKALAPRLSGYLESERAQAVDYALEVFRHVSSPELMEHVRHHFEALFNRHFGQLIEFITHLPERRFLDLLVEHYREGEDDLERLIRFVCDIHQLPYPDRLTSEAQRRAEPGAAASVRLLCPHCQSAFQYACPELFVNEDKIEQRQVPGNRDLWTAQEFECKNCGKPIPFAPDEGFLNDVYVELLAARIVHPNQREALGLNRIQTIAFPLWEGKTVHPSVLLEREPDAMQEPVETQAQVDYLYELGRFYMEVGLWDRAKSALRKILAGPIKFPKALYFLGVVAFQERNLYDARVFFSRLIATCSRDEFESELDNPVDMAQHYLKLLDKREFKRSHFQLIST
jgi:tetratricopeptide (TPR) repeat protein